MFSVLTFILAFVPRRLTTSPIDQIFESDIKSVLARTPFSAPTVKPDPEANFWGPSGLLIRSANSPRSRRMVLFPESDKSCFFVFSAQKKGRKLGFQSTFQYKVIQILNAAVIIGTNGKKLRPRPDNEQQATTRRPGWTRRMEARRRGRGDGGKEESRSGD